MRIDRKRKLPVTTLLYALEGQATEALRAEREAAGETVDMHEIRGMDAEEILNFFYGQVMFTRTPKGWARPFEAEGYRGITLAEPLVDADTGEVVAEAGAKLTQRTARKIAEKTQHRAGRPRRPARPLHGGRPGQRGDRRDLCRGRRGAGRGAADRARGPRHRPRWRRWRSTRRTGRGCATRWRWTRTATATTRWSTSTGSCAPASRRRRRRPRRCSAACSSTPTATTCRRSAGSR